MDIHPEAVIVKEEPPDDETDTVIHKQEEDLLSQFQPKAERESDIEETDAELPHVSAGQPEDPLHTDVKWLDEVEADPGEMQPVNEEDPLSGPVTIKEEPMEEDGVEIGTPIEVISCLDGSGSGGGANSEQREDHSRDVDGNVTEYGCKPIPTIKVEPDEPKTPAVDTGPSGLEFSALIKQQWKGIKLGVLRKASTWGMKGIMKGRGAELEAKITKALETAALNLRKADPKKDVPQEPIYSCYTCAYSTGSKSKLRIHVEKHTQIQPYSCDVCGARFKREDSLQGHGRIHTGEKPFKCDVCDKRFRIERSLKRHKLRHTLERPYECKHCEYRSGHAEDLKSHMRKHTGEKPYMCLVCNARFQRTYNLERHKMTHTGEKPFECDACEKRFTTDGAMRRHKRVHKGEEPPQV